MAGSDPEGIDWPPAAAASFSPPSVRLRRPPGRSVPPRGSNFKKDRGLRLNLTFCSGGERSIQLSYGCFPV